MRPRVGECRGGLARGKAARLRAVQGPAGSAAARNDSLVRGVLRLPDSPCPRPGKRGPWQQLRALRRGPWARYERTQHAPAAAASAGTAAPAASRSAGERSLCRRQRWRPGMSCGTRRPVPDARGCESRSGDRGAGSRRNQLASSLEVARLSKCARATVRLAAPRLQVQPRRAMNGLALRRQRTS
jgi:hypothetical protein